MNDDSQSVETVRVISPSPPFRKWGSTPLYIKARYIVATCVYHSYDCLKRNSVQLMNCADDASQLLRMIDLIRETFGDNFPIYEVQTSIPIYGYSYFLVHADERRKMQCIVNGTDEHLVHFESMLNREMKRQKK